MKEEKYGWGCNAKRYEQRNTIRRRFSNEEKRGKEEREVNTRDGEVQLRNERRRTKKKKKKKGKKKEKKIRYHSLQR